MISFAFFLFKFIVCYDRRRACATNYRPITDVISKPKVKVVEHDRDGFIPCLMWSDIFSLSHYKIKEKARVRKVREVCFKMLIAMQICCYSCQLLRVCHGIHQYESTHVNLREIIFYYLKFYISSIQFKNRYHMEWIISHHHCDFSNLFSYDINRQSVVDKIVREFSLKVREKSGNFVSRFWWEPWIFYDKFCVNMFTFWKDIVGLQSPKHLIRMFARYINIGTSFHNKKIFCLYAIICRLSQSWRRARVRQMMGIKEAITAVGHCHQGNTLRIHCSLHDNDHVTRFII